MSTRGCVAIKHGGKEQWLGVYNHSDSYPTGLGKELWDYLHQPEVNLIRFSVELLKYGDWRDYLGGGICPYCGKVGFGQPCNIRGDIYLAGVEGKMFPDPDAKYHKHSDPDSKIRSTKAKYDALFIEWVYVVDPIARTITVLTSARDKGEHTESNSPTNKWKAPNYCYANVIIIPLDDTEPVWERIEEIGGAISDLYYKTNDAKQGARQ
jgi:hypothetical protein